ncbi:putative hydrolase of the HAD superfamily [Rhodothalassium salexigens DSM 2132]|uniref:Putative hydrolase of the HAD superfamily n=1 Tax=Rhodothalassium salexigens DSM 2132 TaxID=1188247 RepID=A0A4R2PNH1_RHOSA|nr:pyrimidine 5'-nucleotidase [Rhodothalassium salexigens]MBB4211034.1 putative hydrolase of the HAD superfamily [Rhodothalassium salexigens DSM 2132]MBK1637962.1 pyrimidine 5'-nucleotidase [Rhodothalassium salexigens DSM 2132]TCP36308.1 putative hydrolase of the HAD superfamily [Rhodothalassium salexigens DSM 2132]
MTDAGPVETWVFDLDNTLYPPECNLFDQIDQRMGDFIKNLLNVDYAEARRLQKQYFVDYGTTLRGLMDRHNVAPDDFLHHVHDIDVSPVPPNPRLGALLARLPGRKLVYTNGTEPHAERVLARLGVADQFDGVFDIAAGDFVPKPQPAPYAQFMDRFSVDPRRAVMVEDMARNLKPAAALGMTTVWLRTCYQWGGVHVDEAAVHHQVDDLMAWLEELAG